MRILMIGGTGLIGPHVIRRLIGLGHEVTIYHSGRHEAALPPTVNHVHHASFQIPILHFPDDLKRLAPEVVLHMIPMGEHDARCAATTFRDISPRIVAISSMDVYRAYGVLHGMEPGSIEPVPLTEDSPLRQTLYPARGAQLRNDDDRWRWLDDSDKILMEQAIRSESSLVATIVRLPAVYGPEDGHRQLWHLKRMAEQRPAILLEETQARWKWSQIYVENAAAAIALVVTDDRATGRIFNVAEAQTPTTAEWIQQFGQVLGWTGEVISVSEEHLPAHLLGNLNFHQHIELDSTRIRQELGYTEPVAVDEAIRRTIAWEQANPLAEIDAIQFDYAAEDTVLTKLGKASSLSERTNEVEHERV